MSWADVDRTTESSVVKMKLQTWHSGLLHSGAFRLEKSDGTLADPARCCTSAWYRLTTDKNDVTRGLAENLPRLNLLIESLRFDDALMYDASPSRGKTATRRVREQHYIQLRLHEGQRVQHEKYGFFSKSQRCSCRRV